MQEKNTYTYVTRGTETYGYVYLDRNWFDIGDVLEYIAFDKQHRSITIASHPIYVNKTCFKYLILEPKVFCVGEWFLVPKNKVRLESATFELLDFGIKDSSDKLSYQEIDPAFIKLMAERMSKNKDKYPVNNWKKDLDRMKLLDALERHFMDLKCLMLGEPAIHNPDETIEDHLAAIAANSMMINYGRRKGKV